MQSQSNQRDSSGGTLSGDATLAPLDHELLVRRCMGRIELAQKLLASFENRFPAEIVEIEKSLAAGDSTNSLRQIHQLKGAASNVSASALQAVMARMEEAAVQQQSDHVLDCLGVAHREWDRFKRHVGTVDWKRSGQAAVKRPVGS